MSNPHPALQQPESDSQHSGTSPNTPSKAPSATSGIRRFQNGLFHLYGHGYSDEHIRQMIENGSGSV